MTPRPVMNGALVATALLLAACGSDSGSGSGGGINPPPVPGPSAATFDFVVTDLPEGNGALGSVFTFTSADGRYRCAAGYVSSVGTRIFANQNSLEFWCSDGAPARLQWMEIDRPLPGIPTTLLGNVAGLLYDYMAPSWYSGEMWNSNPAPDQASFRGDVMAIRDDARRWTLTLSVPGCEGLSLFALDGYYGTVPADPSIAAAIVWRGAVYANYAESVWRAEVPDAPVATDCEMLPVTLLTDEPMYAYAMMPVGDTLWIGGGGQPFLDDRRHECAPLYATDGSEVEIVELQGCVFPQVTETYSFMYFDEGLHVGVYPDGYLFHVDLDTRKAVRTALPELPPDTFEQSGERYLESQSMTIAAGRPLIGMFPWGEIYELADEQRVYRLFTSPEKTSGAPRPFPDDDANDWSQRITSLVTLDGRVCAGTGNTFQVPYDPAQHPFITEGLSWQYGAVHCADLTNQTMSPHRPVAADATFRVDATHIEILLDGVSVARRPHTLGTGAPAALTAPGGTLEVGSGRYGPARATVVER